MSPEEQALADVVKLLRRLDIPFMLTGSVATSYHGRPRATHHADIVVDPAMPQLDSLVTALDRAGYYVDRESARRALRARTQFNAIEIRHACKVDLIVRRDRAYSVEEFQRRTTVDLPFANGIPIVTAEDAVVSKLEWARDSGDSHRQLADVAGVLALNPTLDRAYIERWTRELGVYDLWTRVSSGV